MATPKFSFKAGRVLMQDGTRTVLDTAAKSFNAVPGAVITIDPFTLSFPDFASKGYRYLYGSQRYNGGNTRDEECRTLGTVNPEERTLPNIDLGALPAGTDFLETRIKLTRTLSPPKMWWSGYPANAGLYDWPSEIIAGQWMPLLGNSMIAERGDNWARLFEIVIASGRAVLRRRQTVGTLGFTSCQIQHQWIQGDPDVNPRKLREGDPYACSNVNTTNYASTYTGVLEITPCSYRSGP